MSSIHPGPPQPGEFAPHFAHYIQKAGSFEDPVSRLGSQLQDATAFFHGIDPAKRLYRYAQDKWSVQELLQHIIDTERIFAYRVLRIARTDQTPLAGFDEKVYTPASEAEKVPWSELVEEFVQVRGSTGSLFRHIPAAAWTRTGTSNNATVSVRALAWIAIGHVEHHMAVVRERYL